MQPANIINHIVLVLDASFSMKGREAELVKVADNQIAYLAQRSKDLDQETRVTVYMFSNRREIYCLIYDKDVLRMPSIKSLYRVMSQTALIDATLLAINDLKMTPEKYGEHAFLIYVLTDGQENNSAARSYDLKNTIDGLPDHWTIAAFVPNQDGKFEAKRFGFPADNVEVWDATSVKGIAEAGETIRRTTETFMQNRKVGIRGSRSLFKLNTLTPDDILSTMTPLMPQDFALRGVLSDSRADDFVRDNGLPFHVGMVFYQLSKPEIIQSQKRIAILFDGRVYIGYREIRRVLGLPDDESVKVIPENYPYTIFVESTAPNRKLIAGTRALILTA